MYLPAFLTYFGKNTLILSLSLITLFLYVKENKEEKSEVTTPRAFYPITSFASHDCVNNTFRTLKNGLLQTRAKIDMKGKY